MDRIFRPNFFHSAFLPFRYLHKCKMDYGMFIRWQGSDAKRRTRRCNNNELHVCAYAIMRFDVLALHRNSIWIYLCTLVERRYTHIIYSNVDLTTNSVCVHTFGKFYLYWHRWKSCNRLRFQSVASKTSTFGDKLIAWAAKVLQTQIIIIYWIEIRSCASHIHGNIYPCSSDVYSAERCEYKSTLASMVMA